ncbi:tetratricopeptide repeat-containing protein [Mycena maculata]|uniref:Tetratricopeptide repeat-containing protein n=1 Tax=Mycena maculata TaxID=230809 RepID=A0AAD7JNQ4_9AGAR|nr:tetratricopeptide repeat-containing protein [Mycena maculata]
MAAGNTCGRSEISVDSEWRCNSKESAVEPTDKIVLTIGAVIREELRLEETEGDWTSWADEQGQSEIIRTYRLKASKVRYNLKNRNKLRQILNRQPAPGTELRTSHPDGSPELRSSLSCGDGINFPLPNLMSAQGAGRLSFQYLGVIPRCQIKGTGWIQQLHFHHSLMAVLLPQNDCPLRESCGNDQAIQQQPLRKSSTSPGRQSTAESEMHSKHLTAVTGSNDINKAIQLHREALALHATLHPARGRLLDELGVALYTRFRQEGDVQDIDEAIVLHREALALRDPPHPNRGSSLSNLGNAIFRRFEQHGDSQDINEAIVLHREALALRGPPHPDRGQSLNNLANAVHTRFEERGDSQDIDETIVLHREALTLRGPSHPDRSQSLNNLANAIHTRFDQRGDSQDLDEAIVLHREALGLRGPPHPDHSQSLNNLANAIHKRFDERGDEQDINEAILLHREALALCASPHPDRGMSLNNLANAIHTRFTQHGNSQDIDEAILLHREGLALRGPPHPDHSQSLNNLANAIHTRFEQRGDSQDLDEAIVLHRDALALRGPPHPDRGSSLSNLAIAICERFEQRGDSQDIDEAIVLHRHLLFVHHPTRNVARFGQHGHPQDIEETILLHREALALRASPHQHGQSLDNLAYALHIRFEVRGDSQDIDEAIALHREALALHASPHPYRGMLLNNLAIAIHTRFEQRGDSQDINEAIVLHREALALRGPPHPDHSQSLNNLAYAIQARFGQHGHRQDINEAILLHKEALALRASPHPQRGQSLNNLAYAIQTRFGQRGVSQDIDEAIVLHREALTLHGPPHPRRSFSLNNLANAIHTRFDQHGDSQDIDEAIQLHREALGLREAPHPNRGESLQALALCLAMMYQRTHDGYDLDAACDLFREAATYQSSSPLTRFNHARSWAATTAQFGHSSCLTAYHEAIEFLPQLAALHLDLHSRQDILSTTNVTTLASEASACAVGLGRYNVAVEFLEASRSVFWSQALHLRTPLDTLAGIHPGLAHKLTELSRQLERTSFRDISKDLLTNAQDKIIAIESEGKRCRELNENWEQVLNSVRMLPGFDDFMRPKGIGALKQAAASGPIIILTATSSTCFALIVTSSNEVQCLPLPELILPTADVLADLSRGLSNPAFDLESFATTRTNHQDLMELKARLVGGREGSINVDDVFRRVLAHLWKVIVKPVFEVLNIQKTVDPQRLWWCPTGPFTFLPIHAAGTYGPNDRDCVSDYVISSYTPTLTALLDTPAHTAPSFKVTAVIQPDAPNCSPLPGAEQELKKIITRVPNQWLTSLKSTTVETALNHLRDSSIAHFACHGVQDSNQPLDSGLQLTDGRLTVSQIMRSPENSQILDVRQYMSLAFLSACETAKGDRTRPDEAMHLAATLLFAGFRGVVATMWTMDDRDGPKIADTFYEHLFENCDPNSSPPILPDLTGAAKALQIAIAKLREEPDALLLSVGECNTVLHMSHSSSFNRPLFNSAASDNPASTSDVPNVNLTVVPIDATPSMAVDGETFSSSMLMTGIGPL